MKRSKILLPMAAGFLLGMTVTGPAAQAVQTYLQAIPSTQTFYLNGYQVTPEAYSIAGYNYVRLAELCQLLGLEVIYQAENNSVHVNTTEQEKDPVLRAEDGTVTLPEDGSQYIPQVGDRISCTDGTIYHIRNVDRYFLSSTAPGNLPELPTAVWDGSLFPQTQLPEPVARHFNNAGDELFLRNLYETRRMQYTLYAAAQRAGHDKLNIQLGIPAVYEAMTQVFWPWNEGELTKQIPNSPYGTYYVEAWDYYLNGVFQHTRYYLTIR